MSEKELMDQNTQEYIDQYEQARNTLEENYGVSMDASEWEIFWRAFGDSEVVSKYGSDTIVYLGEEIREDPNLTMKQAAQIAAKTLEKGNFSSETDLRIKFNENVDAYKSLRWGNADHVTRSLMSDSEAMDQLFND